MVPLAIFKSSSIQHDVHLVNDGPIYSKIDDKAGSALGFHFLAIDNLLLLLCHSNRFNLYPHLNVVTSG